MSASPSQRRQSGFTLVETLIAATLLLVALALASQLLVEAQRAIALAPRDLRRPDLELVVRQLRADLRGGRPTSATALGFDFGDLALRTPDGVVVWSAAEETLSRTVIPLSGAVSGARPMLPEVVWFDWAELLPGLVEIELVHRVEERALAVRLSTPLWARRERHLETVRFSVAARSDR